MNQDPYPPTDPALLSQVKDLGAQAAWDAFYNRYWRLILRYALKKGLNRHDAEDVLQETMHTLREKLPLFDYDPARGRFRSWLLNITHRKVQEARYELRRQQGKEPLVENFHLPCPEADSADTTEKKEQDLLLETIKEEALLRLRERVTSDNFQVFTLLMKDELSAQEIAPLVGKTPNAIYQIRSRCTAIFEEEFSLLYSQLRD